MDIEIDQSGKVEQTGKDTVVACATKKGFARSLRISAREKRKLQKFFRKIGKPSMYVYKVFSVLIVMLIRTHLDSFDRIIIDTEYWHQDHILRNLIVEILRKDVPSFDPARIIFRQIGKNSPAHDVANATYKRKQKPTLQVTAREVLAVIV